MKGADGRIGSVLENREKGAELRGPDDCVIPDPGSTLAVAFTGLRAWREGKRIRRSPP